MNPDHTLYGFEIDCGKHPRSSHQAFLGCRRQLVRQRLSMLRTAALSRLRAALQTVFPELEQVFKAVDNPTATALLHAFPGPDEFLAAPRQKVMHVLRKASRGHLGEAVYARLRAGAEASVALPGTRAGLKRELRLLQDQLALYKRHIKALQDSMVEVMRQIPEAACLTSIPGVAPVSAAVFLGSVGDVRAYRSSRQVLKLAGMSLVEDSSGIRHGYDRLSKSGRPLLRRLAFMLGLRAVRSDGFVPGQLSGNARPERRAEDAGGRSHGPADALPHVRDRARATRVHARASGPHARVAVRREGPAPPAGSGRSRKPS